MLIREAEHTAREKGCYIYDLATFDFQARGLYEKHGYTVYAVREDLPKGHTNYSLAKRLDQDTPPYMPTYSGDAKRYDIKIGTEKDAETISNGLEQYNDSYLPHGHENIALGRKLVDKDGKIIAGIIAEVDGLDYGYIANLGVEELYRDQGLGAYLLCEVEWKAKENGAYALTVWAYDWNVDFFKKSG